MSKYLFVYYGGISGTTPKEVEKSMTEWNAWFKSMGKSLADMGAPTMPGKMVSSTGVRTTAAAQAVTGYTVVTAGSMDAAVNMAKDAPGMDKGMKVAVFPLADMTPPTKK